MRKLLHTIILEVKLKEGYKLVSKNISYNIIKKILNSSENSIFTDIDGNIIETTMFQYDIKIIYFLR